MNKYLHRLVATLLAYYRTRLNREYERAYTKVLDAYDAKEYADRLAERVIDEAAEEAARILAEAENKAKEAQARADELADQTIESARRTVNAAIAQRAVVRDEQSRYRQELAALLED